MIEKQEINDFTIKLKKKSLMQGKKTTKVRSTETRKKKISESINDIRKEKF